MKKLLLSTILVAISLVSFAQTAIPNAGFETWEDAVCEGEAPSNYTTGADLAQQTGFPCPEATGIAKSTNKYAGTYALEITPRIALESTLNNGVFLFEEFTGRPSKLIGYTKFTKGGTDTLGIAVAIGNDDDEDEIASAEVTISESQNGYTKFEIPFVYNTANTSKVTGLAIFITIGDKKGLASESTIALIDELSLVYAPTATVNYKSTSSINVFASNKTINFSENVSDVHVVDMVGSSKMQEAASTKALNAASLNTGLYIVTYKYNDNYYSKKVVIE